MIKKKIVWKSRLIRKIYIVSLVFKIYYDIDYNTFRNERIALQVENRKLLHDESKWDDISFDINVSERTI